MSILMLIYSEALILMTAYETIILDETLLEYSLILFVTVFLANEWQVSFQELALRRQHAIRAVYKSAHKKLLHDLYK